MKTPNGYNIVAISGIKIDNDWQINICVDSNGTDYESEATHDDIGIAINQAAIAADKKIEKANIPIAIESETSILTVAGKLSRIDESDDTILAPAGTGQRCGAANDCARHKKHGGKHRNCEGSTW